MNQLQPCLDVIQYFGPAIAVGSVAGALARDAIVAVLRSVVIPYFKKNTKNPIDEVLAELAARGIEAIPIKKDEAQNESRKDSN